jgi:hypothetical protein
MNLNEVLDGKNKLVAGIFSVAYLSCMCILGSVTDLIDGNFPF